MSLQTYIIIGFVLFAAAACFTLIHAVWRAEEGFQDSTGYHRKLPDPVTTAPSPADTGNPWDQIEGSSCPWTFNPGFRPAGHDKFSAPQP